MTHHWLRIGVALWVGASLSVAACGSPTRKYGPGTAGAGGQGGGAADGSSGTGGSSGTPSVGGAGNHGGASAAGGGGLSAAAGEAGSGGEITPGDPCDQLTCQHGVCVAAGATASCSCTAGYSGALCDIDTDDCVANECQNQSDCVDQVAGYVCNCSNGFAGDHCEKKVSSCADAPCAHAGICTDTATSYTCQCPPEYMGTNCTADVDECASSNPCVHGICTNTVGAYLCGCANTGYQGKNCDQDVDECTSNNPCVHGTCSNSAGSYACSCTGTGYQGKNCDQNIDDCAAKPCLNGAKCTDLVNDFSCSCTSNFFGKNCSTARFRGVGIPTAAPDGFVVRAASSNPATPVVLVGTGYKSSSSSTFAMRWTDAAGFQLLSSTSGSVVNAVSGDGLVSAGTLAGVKAGVRWLASNNTNQSIGFGLGADSTQPNGTDAVGNAVAGTATYNPSATTRAFRWAADAPYAEIAMDGSIGTAVSGDGLFLLGSFPVVIPSGATRLHGFRWSYASRVLLDLGVPAASSWDVSNALASNRTATVVVGQLSANFGASIGAFRWENGVMVDLGSVGQSTNATALSEDGSIVVGCPDWIWDKTNGIRVLSSVLTAAGVNLAGWSGLCPVSISTDGKRIVGWGTSASSSAWIAQLP